MTAPETLAARLARGQRALKVTVTITAIGLAILAVAFGYSAALSADRAHEAQAARADILRRAQVLEDQVRGLGEKPAGDLPEPGQPVAGPQGIPGLTGQQGEPGDRGQRGPRGFRGRQGRTGATGRTGAPGRPGRPGADSTVPGPQGPPGESIVGPQGPQGEVGPQGPPPACEPNCVGPAGPPGPQGPQGVGIADITCDSTTPISFTVTLTDGSTLTFSCGGPPPQ